MRSIENKVYQRVLSRAPFGELYSPTWFQQVDPLTFDVLICKVWCQVRADYLLNKCHKLSIKCEFCVGVDMKFASHLINLPFSSLQNTPY